MLFFTFGISEAQINKLHFVFVQHRQNVFSGHTYSPGLVMVVVVTKSSILQKIGRVAVKKIKRNLCQLLNCP